jgi:hypothetical protein
MPVSLATVVAPADDVAFREIDREAVVLNLTSGRYFGLNGVATRAWQLLAGGAPVGVVIDRLHAEFDVHRDVVERDVTSWVSALIDKGLVRAR